ncbi:hydrolase [Desulfuribacillus alkaliarsenatis]|uniref:Hydrolase n=1 Tax=Desulfuribacillus alkaliarsenatis TaxID=766136 RepID=A0A1E5G0C8_9FIRM|nr:hydrolase [Desulfuribacillus alkaliarsenatis]OEF96203.1 hydrolase [Desulfuribacillus alkaliarsenatis]
MLDKDNTVLVVVDVQGKLAQSMFDKENLFINLQKLIKGAQILEIPIIVVEQYPEGLGATVDEVKGLFADWQPIEKHCYSCCENEDFINRLLAVNKNQVLLAGIETHICIYQTAVDLLSKNFDVEVVIDAVSSRTEANKNAGIEKIVSLGASFTTVEMALFELLKVSKGDKFKELLKVIK